MAEYIAMKVILKLFEEVYGRITEELVWNKYWNSSSTRMTGIFTNPVYKLKIERNTFYRLVDGYGRKAIVIGTKLGAVVLYQSQSGVKNKEIWVDADARVKALKLLALDKPTVEDFKCLVGYDDAIPSFSQLLDLHVVD